MNGGEVRLGVVVVWGLKVNGIHVNEIWRAVSYSSLLYSFFCRFPLMSFARRHFPTNFFDKVRNVVCTSPQSTSCQPNDARKPPLMYRIPVVQFDQLLADGLWEGPRAIDLFNETSLSKCRFDSKHSSSRQFVNKMLTSATTTKQEMERSQAHIN